MPFRAGSVSSWVDRLDLLAAGGVEVVRDAGEAALPRQRVDAARVELDVLQRRLEVGGVGDVGRVELLDVALADEARDHPVGAAPDVTAGVLAALEEGAHLGVELVVVVVVLGVVDLDAGLLGEGIERGTRLLVLRDVDVLGPVGPVDDLVGVAQVLGGGRRSGRPSRTGSRPCPRCHRRSGRPWHRGRARRSPGFGGWSGRAGSAARMIGDIGSGVGARPSVFSSRAGARGWGQRAGCGVSGVFRVRPGSATRCWP